MEWCMATVTGSASMRWGLLTMRSFRIKKADEKTFSDLITFVRNSNGIKKIRPEAESYVEKASGFLTSFPDSSYKKDLIALNEYIAKRHY